MCSASEVMPSPRLIGVQMLGPTRNTHDPSGTARTTHVSSRPLLPGDPGYLEWIGERRDFLSPAEYRSRKRLHLRLFRALQPPGSEAETEAELIRLFDARAVV